MSGINFIISSVAQLKTFHTRGKNLFLIAHKTCSRKPHYAREQSFAKREEVPVFKNFIEVWNNFICDMFIDFIGFYVLLRIDQKCD